MLLFNLPFVADRMVAGFIWVTCVNPVALCDIELMVAKTMNGPLTSVAKCPKFLEMQTNLKFRTL